MYHRLEIDKVRIDIPKLKSSITKLPISMEIENLFRSIPNFNQSNKASEDFILLKFQEGLMALRHIDEKFLPTLFDFSEPWKIDILDFLNQNYTYEFSMDDIANFTGRSLSAFKRDFKKVSDLTPQKWLIRKRLENVSRGQSKPYKEDSIWAEVENLILDREKEEKGVFEQKIAALNVDEVVEYIVKKIKLLALL